VSFPRYPRYKDSGVEWLAEVPEHWSVAQLKRVVTPTRPITYGIVQAGPHVVDGIPYIRPADMSDEGGVVSVEELLRTSPEIAADYRRSAIRTGDLVCSIGPSFGKVMVTPAHLDGANLTQGTARVAVRPDACARFVFWVLRSTVSVAQWESSVGGATFRALNLGPLTSTAIAIPPIEDQRSIAAFLDRETAKIDSLIAEQQRLIELLKEKRQAVISHAVTRGLEPDAPMKPSGVEWLGDVPAHWEVWKLSHVFEIIGSGTTPKTDVEDYYLDGEIPWVNTGDLRDGILDSCGGRVTTRALAEHTSLRIYPAGSLAVAMYGATIGRLAILGFRATVNQACCVFGGNSAILVEFLFYWLLGLRAQVISLATGGGQPNISQEILRGLRVAAPSTDEQLKIVHRLDTLMRQSRLLVDEAERATTLLQEHRTALISAAVTGKIDVRGLAEAA